MVLIVVNGKFRHEPSFKAGGRRVINPRTDLVPIRG